MLHAVVHTLPTCLSAEEHARDRQVDNRLTPEALRDRKPGDRQHGQPAIVDLVRALVEKVWHLGLKAKRVEAQVAWYVLLVRLAQVGLIDVVNRLQLDEGSAGRDQEEEGRVGVQATVEQRRRSAIGERKRVERVEHL